MKQLSILTMPMMACCITPLAGCDALSGLTGKGASAEETCSSQQTYDSLTQLMSSQASSSASLLGGNNALSTAASPSSMKSVLSYSSPTVDEVNKATGKVSCKALLRVAVQTTSLGDQQGLTANDFGPDHVTYQIAYSLQPTADKGQPLVTLESASALSNVAFQASLIALKRSGDAAASAQAGPSTPETEDDSSAEPTQEEAQERSDEVNAQEAALNADSDAAPAENSSVPN